MSSCGPLYDMPPEKIWAVVAVLLLWCKVGYRNLYVQHQIQPFLSIDDVMSTPTSQHIHRKKTLGNPSFMVVTRPSHVSHVCERECVCVCVWKKSNSFDTRYLCYLGYVYKPPTLSIYCLSSHRCKLLTSQRRIVCFCNCCNDKIKHTHHPRRHRLTSLTLIYILAWRKMEILQRKKKENDS